MHTAAVPDPADAFRTLDLPDARLYRRLAVIMAGLTAHPAHSFPNALGKTAGAEGLYRFLAHPAVTYEGLLEAQRDATRAAVAGNGVTLLLHDTSLFQFSATEVRPGTCRTSNGKSGFYGHVCLAVSGDGKRVPIGLMDLIPVVRVVDGEAAVAPAVAYENESERWLDLVRRVQQKRPAGATYVHLRDSEADHYDLFYAVIDAGGHFVIRLSADRKVADPKRGRRGPDDPPRVHRVSDVLENAEVRLLRSVRLSARVNTGAPKVSKRNLPRDERDAQLGVRVAPAEIKRPWGSAAKPPRCAVNIVEVMEVDPPEGEVPVSWRLVTTLPVDTPEQVAAVVDAYRARWLIEEWFKAMKTGCAYEDRQLESIDTLLKAFVLLAPVATRLLTLRWLAHNETDCPATVVLSVDEIRFLRAIERTRKRDLPPNPTVYDVMLAIAKMGGFLTSNKVPGWRVLGRGFEEFSLMYEGYLIAREGGEM